MDTDDRRLTVMAVDTAEAVAHLLLASLAASDIVRGEHLARARVTLHATLVRLEAVLGIKRDVLTAPPPAAVAAAEAPPVGNIDQHEMFPEPMTGAQALARMNGEATW